MQKIKNLIYLFVLCLLVSTFLLYYKTYTLADDEFLFNQSVIVRNTDLSSTDKDDSIVNENTSNTIKTARLNQTEKNVIVICSSVVIVLFSLICILLVRK